MYIIRHVYRGQVAQPNFAAPGMIFNNRNNSRSEAPIVQTTMARLITQQLVNVPTAAKH